MGGHASYADCLRSANPRVSFTGTLAKATESELAEYRALRAEGIQPMGTTRRALDAAKALSDRYGGAFNAETGLVDSKVPVRGELV